MLESRAGYASRAASPVRTAPQVCFLYLSRRSPERGWRRDLVIAAPLRRAQDKNARGLIERVRRLRPFQSADVGGSTPRIEGLERRLAALKAALEGLQDAEHRGSVGQDDEMAALRKRRALSQMARALSDDVRWRGI